MVFGKFPPRQFSPKIPTGEFSPVKFSPVRIRVGVRFRVRVRIRVNLNKENSEGGIFPWGIFWRNCPKAMARKGFIYDQNKEI